jgi:hypothetical protein
MTIYFDKNKDAYGFEIKDYIAYTTDELWGKVCNDRNAWDIRNGVFTDLRNTQEYKDKQKSKEKERIARLSCTKRHFVLLLQEQGISYKNTLKPLIEANEQASIEWELCERLYRFNPLLDQMAEGLGITSEQLDTIFKVANGEVA